MAVSHALTLRLLTGTTPLWTSDKSLHDSIKALQTDEKTLHGKDRTAIGADLKLLKDELVRRTQAAADKTARAATIAGLVTRQAIRDKNLSVTTNVRNNNATYINGRLLNANLSRYTSVINGSVVNATSLSGV